MTSIPANVQKYLATSRTEQPKAQAAESKGDFGKVFDKQKAGTAGDNSVKASQQKQTGEARNTSQKGEVSTAEKATASGQPENGQAPVEETSQQQNQATEQADVSGQPKAEQTDVSDQPKVEQVDVSDQPKVELPIVESSEETLSAEEQVDSELAVETPPTEEEDDLEQVMEVLQSAILQIQELLTQQLDMTVDDLKQLMQEKGITDMQLLQPEVVNQLVLDATGAEDPLSLVMDEELYQSQQAINRGFREITHQLKQELEEDGEELAQVLQKLENSVSGISGNAVQGTEVTAENPQQGKSQEHDGPGRGRGQEQNITGQVFYQNYTAQAQNQTAGQISAMTVGREATYVEIPDSQQIMNQVLDYMKVSMRPENTVLDMQLHPESLGTLHVQISAREGIMTAHFTASSEAVKTVLENQMVVLKENFLQQDIKVEAIEVTVETHQFEDSLDQGRQRSEEEAGRRPKRRRLDVSSLESGEELTESEQIITEMMAANGNTVDYLA